MKVFLIFFLASIVSAASFLKTDEATEEDKIASGYFGNVLQTIFNLQVDLNNFDFHGNELGRPDLTLEKGHFLCYQTGNDSKLFRKFAGLIKESPCFFNFWRVDELKSHYYPAKEVLDTKPTEHGSTSTPSSCKLPELKLTGEQLSLGEKFVIDLLLTVIPSIEGTLIDYPADGSGILMLMFLKQVKDFEGYYDDFMEFYGLMQRFAMCTFELPAVTGGNVNPKILIEQLFRLAVKLDLPYTLEAFYALDLVDFGNSSLLKFVLETARCPLVINRFFDFVPWNDGLIDGIPKIHFVYENYSEYLGLLFEYEPSRVNWRVVDSSNFTLLGKLLPNLTKAVFSEGQSTVKNSSRELLKEFLSHATPKESAGTFITAEKDILMECFESEVEGLRLLVEYVDNAVDIRNVIEDYLMRVVRFWKATESVTLTKVFKYLVKKTEQGESKTVLPILIEAFDFFNERLSKEASESDSRSNSRNSTSSNQSGKSVKFNRSSSGTDFFKAFFADTSSNVAVPKSPRSPKAKQNMEMMKFIAQEAERIVAKDDVALREIISHWNVILSSYEYF